MRDEEILELVLKALERFHNEDQFLLDKDLCERCVMHKLAEKMTMLFPEYDVDCEYNKKTLEGTQKKLVMIRGRDTDDRERTHFSSPDIIVHKRGNDDNDLLVIEMKVKKRAKAIDLEKLTGLTEPERQGRNYFPYQLGMFLQVNLQQGEDKFLLYKEGRKGRETVRRSDIYGNCSIIHSLNESLSASQAVPGDE